MKKEVQVLNGIGFIRTKEDVGVMEVKENEKEQSTMTTVKQQAKPVISTGNYPLQVLRDNMESIQAACEGTEAVSSQSYEYKDKIIEIKEEKCIV